MHDSIKGSRARQRALRWLPRGGLVGVAVLTAAACGDAGRGEGAGGGASAEAMGRTGEALSAPQVCIAIQRGVSGTVADTLLVNKAPYGNNGTSAALVTGLVSGTERETLLRFDLSAIPAGATINSAILSLYDGAIASSPATLNVHRVTAAWNETTVTWPSFNQAFDPAIVASFSNTLNPASTNALVPLVQGWVNGTYANQGMLLEQAYFGTNFTQLQSSESPSVAQRPRLDVCYTVACAPGFADCDGVGQNGCEKAITTITDCGACGAACSVANAAAACAFGSCGIASCNAGFADCDGKASTGCETSLATATNCGGCGIACAAANGTSTCANGTCALVGCNAGFFDCDGNPANGCEALPCNDGQHCGHGPECASGVCQSGICAAPSCADGVQNGAETAVDCGGTICPPCAAGQGCLAGNDCAAGVCRSGVCAPAACDDSVRNGGETGADCGGPSCAPCAAGIACVGAPDCQSGVCVGGFCQAPSCNDGIKNGNESGVDCGGGVCKPCAAGIGCAGASDCADPVCVNGVCQMASCTDGVKDGAETDVDCGGSCGPCGVTQLCTTGADCAAGACVGGHCQAPTCSDGIQNGDETGVDCGGSCFVAEVCDGIDNDCNGTIDDGLGTTTCGIGACQVTVPACSSGSAAACVPGAPTAEICDGLLDDDCDGTVDNGCTCTNGQTQPCYTGSASTNSVGTCHNGNQTCVMGQWAACVGEQLPVAETCDGQDNDCNGQADDGLGSSICGVGTCQTMVQNCVAGQPQTCVPGKPGAESCDGQDNDCNGQVDDGLGTIPCGVGACGTSVPACAGGVPAVCVAAQPGVETCDGIDNDCDGVIDNGNPGGGVACSTGQLGICGAGTTVCSGGALTCVRNQAPTAETCDGIDNDCNGVIDNGNPGSGAACATGLQGICGAGTTTCAGGQLACNATQSPKAETCNGLDDDCDGVIDEGNPGGGMACTTGQLGVCSAGTTVCSGGSVVCNRNQNPAAETCNGLDDDCNGVIDNGNPGGGVACSTGQAGICSAGTTVCTGGALACNRTNSPTAETCNGQDDDCNGVIDNGAASSCASGVCAAGVCKAPTCSDGIKNGSEVAVDCGGGCGPCWISDGPPAYSHTQGCFWSFQAGTLDGHKSLDMSGATAANMIADFGVATFVDAFAANAWSSAYAKGGMKDFAIDSSPDKVTWTTQYVGLHPSVSTTQYYSFPGATARYWRLRITSFYMNFGTSCGTGQFQGGFQFRAQ